MVYNGETKVGRNATVVCERDSNRNTDRGGLVQVESAGLFGIPSPGVDCENDIHDTITGAFLSSPKQMLSCSISTRLSAVPQKLFNQVTRFLFGMGMTVTGLEGT